MEAAQSLLPFSVGDEDKRISISLAQRRYFKLAKIRLEQRLVHYMEQAEKEQKRAKRRMMAIGAR